MKKIRIFVIIALAAMLLMSGCAMRGYEEDYRANYDDPYANNMMPNTDDGLVTDGDGMIGNERANDPAGDNKTDATVPESAIPQTTAPAATPAPKAK